MYAVDPPSKGARNDHASGAALDVPFRSQTTAGRAVNVMKSAVTPRPSASAASGRRATTSTSPPAAAKAPTPTIARTAGSISSNRALVLGRAFAYATKRIAPTAPAASPETTLAIHVR